MSIYNKADQLSEWHTYREIRRQLPNDTTPRTVGTQIRQWRLRKGWTQSQLAERLGVSNVSVSLWETDKVHPLYNWEDLIVIGAIVL